MKKKPHRTPSKPATWNSPKGFCRFCGEKIVESGVHKIRKNWHTGCLTIWLIMTSPSDARRHVWKREKGVCQGCGKDSWSYDDRWQADHHMPLFEATDLSFWHPDNLRLLCNRCHQAKSKEEAQRRAQKRKENANG